MTYLASMVLGLRFCSHLGISATWQEKIGRTALGCETFLTCENAADVLHMFRQKGEEWFCGREIGAAEGGKQDETEALVNRTFRLRQGQKVEFEWFIDHYLPLSGKEDEWRATENKKRMRGLELSGLASRFGEESPRKIWKKMIKVIDSGKGTLMLAVNKAGTRQYVDSLLLAGEQNFACNEETLIFFGAAFDAMGSIL